MPFICNICAEESARICARCTKDTCGNHLCDRCFRCSDCCECEVTLSEPVRDPVRTVYRSATLRFADHSEAAAFTASAAPAPSDPDPLPLPDPEPDPDRPNPEPDRFPGEEPLPGPAGL